ncbi:hypothetical protein PsorP6_017068 [Peronosclerospora sorghi]|uniref:Uncharacterized protein n=1 Tax=Peronosclerospora sorghi TaxID=230839 RepID=A0ACC0WFZ4_9STRA|nr:hypothetical protein PsorP6_017068 [Peronosclerospora sorghi]
MEPIRELHTRAAAPETRAETYRSQYEDEQVQLKTARQWMEAVKSRTYVMRKMMERMAAILDEEEAKRPTDDDAIVGRELMELVRTKSSNGFKWRTTQLERLEEQRALILQERMEEEQRSKYKRAAIQAAADVQ